MSDEDHKFLTLACLMLGIPFRLAEQRSGQFALFWHPGATQCATAHEAMAEMRQGGWKLMPVSTLTELRHYSWKLHQLYPEGVISFTSAEHSVSAEQLKLFPGEEAP